MAQHHRHVLLDCLIDFRRDAGEVQQSNYYSSMARMGTYLAVEPTPSSNDNTPEESKLESGDI